MAKQIKTTVEQAPQRTHKADIEAECCDLYNEYCYPCADEATAEETRTAKSQAPRIERADKR